MFLSYTSDTGSSASTMQNPSAALLQTHNKRNIWIWMMNDYSLDMFRLVISLVQGSQEWLRWPNPLVALGSAAGQPWPHRSSAKIRSQCATPNQRMREKSRKYMKIWENAVRNLSSLSQALHQPLVLLIGLQRGLDLQTCVLNSLNLFDYVWFLIILV